MKGQWLMRQNNQRLLLFFNGWGMDAEPFYFLSGAADVFMLYDYRTLLLPFDPGPFFSPYRDICILAWSLGVWVSQWCKTALAVHPAWSVAINGTLQPIHPRHGIAPDIFNATLSHFSAQTLDRFYANMFHDRKDALRFLSQPPARDLPGQQDELRTLQRLIEGESLSPGAWDFDLAVIGQHDVIMPAKHQLRFWKKQAACRIMACGHYPFYQWRTWEDLLCLRPS
ncbi:DUF452 family protein [candidate division FCPU426 bacterium]|nr:DUF452 family protein [candidate division FCPU426 bacterium]